MNLKTYAPSIIIAGIIVVSAPFMRPVKADQSTLAERIEKLNALAKPAQPSAVVPAVVIFGASQQYVDGYPVSYYIYNVQSSPNAPKVAEQAPFADTLESLMAQGFRIQKSDGWTFIMVRQ